MIKAIIFDMDGLMVDTERLYYEADLEIAAQHGETVDYQVVAQMMGQKPLDAMMIFRDSLELDLSPTKLLNERDKIFLEKLKVDLLPMPGLIETINALYAKYKLAVTTGAPQKFTDFILDGLEIRGFFEVIQTSDTINIGKPAPEIYLKTIERLHLTPPECIVLEDSSNGALSAKRAGCYTIAIPSIYTQHQDFSFTDYIAEDLIGAKKHIIACLVSKYS